MTGHLPVVSVAGLLAADTPSEQLPSDALLQTWHRLFFLFFFFWVTGELSTLRQMMEVPNEPGLTPNNGLENAFLKDQSMASNPRKAQTQASSAAQHLGCIANCTGQPVNATFRCFRARRNHGVISFVTTACIQLGLLVSLLTYFHRPPCSRTTCLLDIAWLGDLAGQGAVLDAGVYASRIGAYMVGLAVVLALYGDTHVS